MAARSKSPGKTIRRRIFRVCRYLLLTYALYLVISLLLPPLLQGKAGPQVWDPPPSSGMERVLCVEENEEALLWRLRMITLAEREIILSTFDFRDDNSGQDIMAALLEAAERGVQVRIIVDGVSGFLRLRGSRHFQALAAMPNVEAKIYNPVNLWTPWTLNYRLHDKYLIVDDTAYLLGGRNTFDLFLGSYVDTYNIDRDVLVYEETPGENSSLTQLKTYFEGVWAVEDSQRVSAGATDEVKAAQEELRVRGEALRSSYPGAFESFDWERETIAANQIALLSGSVKPGNKEPELWASLCALMEAGEDIQIQTPYIICNRSMYADLTELCAGGRRVQIMTNAPENGANPFGCTDYLSQKTNILSTGASVAEWLGGQSLHTKTILIDDSISVVGSFNLDMRSAYLDTELMLVIDCPELNQELRAGFAQMAEQSRIAFPDGSTEIGAQCQEPVMSLGMKVRYGILRVVLYPVRYLL